MIPHVWLKEAIESVLDGRPAYPLGTPEGVDPPYVVFERTSTTREAVLSDALANPGGGSSLPVEAKFTVDVYADGYVDVWNIAEAVVAALHGRGEEDVFQCWVEETSDGEPTWLEGHALPTYAVQIHVSVSYTP